MSNKKLRPVLLNILKKKCPRCQRSDLFNLPLDFSDPLAMPKNCKVCKQKLEPEPGFYYGAMFISYIFTSFVILAIAGLCIIGFGWGVYGTFALIIFLCIISFLWVVRISRSIWIHIVVHYDPEYNSTKEK